MMPVAPLSNWHKATWLIAATASVVLLVLVFGAVRLTTSTERPEQVNAFPGLGLPTGGLLTPQPRRTDTLVLPPPSSYDADQSPPAPTQPGTGESTSLEAPTGDELNTQPTEPDGAPTGGPPSIGGTGPSPGPGADPEINATDRFFDLLPEDVTAAWQMLEPGPQQQGFGEFSRSWRRYQDVQLQHVTIGTDATTVTASIVVTERKGTSATQRWKLTFKGGDEPVIDELVLLDDDPSATDAEENTP